MEVRKWGGGGRRTRPQHKGAWGAQNGQQEMKTEGQREVSIEDTECGNSTCSAGCRRVLLCVGPESDNSLTTLMASSWLYLLGV